jgi:hypothetical protein
LELAGDGNHDVVKEPALMKMSARLLKDKVANEKGSASKSRKDNRVFQRLLTQNSHGTETFASIESAQHYDNYQ